MTPPRLLVLPAAALALGLAAATSRAAPEGPAFGTNRASAVISNVDGEPDVDDYVAPLLEGESLSLTVAATGRSKLLPAVALLDPAGRDRTPALTLKKGGRSVSFKSFPADVTGRWTVRVSGDGGTQGAYVAAFKLHAATKFGTRKGTLGGEVPKTATHTFEATNGALVSMKLRPLGKGTVQVATITDPGHGTDAGMLASLSVKRGVTTLRNYDVVRGSGTYGVDVATDDDAVRYRLDVSVKPVPRAKGSKRYRRPEPRLSPLAAPLRIAATFQATFDGHDLSARPPVRVVIGGVEAQVDEVAADGSSVTVTVPFVPAPALLDVTVQNPDGQAFTRPGLVAAVGVPGPTALRDAADRSVTKGRIVGGDEIDLLGSAFDGATRVYFDDVEATVSEVAPPGRLRIVTPPHARGFVVVRAEDDFGRSANLPQLFLYAYPGWGEGDGGRLPAMTPADDYSARRAAVGDLDHDARADDLVLVSPVPERADGLTGSGTRGTRTRLLVEGADGSFTDVTDQKLPGAWSLAAPYDGDDWNAGAVALGDLDAARGTDILLLGFSESTGDGTGEGFGYGQNVYASGLRTFRADAAGRFTLTAADHPKADRLRTSLTCLDENGVERPLFGRFGDERGDAAAIAVGDLDGNGTPDVVAARDESAFRRVLQDLARVDFSKDPARVPAADADAFDPAAELILAHLSGTEILDNRIAAGGGLVPVTELRMPFAVGGERSPDLPAAPGLHADDVALADLDGDGDLDLVLTWHDPTTVSVRGLASFLQAQWDGVSPATSIDVPRIATRVLLNDGTGRFTDATAAWMPAGASPEWWQADRLALADLDGDGDPDLVLVSRLGVEAWTTTALADVAPTAAGGTDAPLDLAAAETESWTFAVPASARCVVEVSLGTLLDSTLGLYAPGQPGTPVATDDDGGDGLGSRIVRDLTPGTWTVRVAGFSPADAGTYTLSVRLRPDTPAAVPRTRTALRVLRNDRGLGRFTDVTAVVVPSLPDGDDLRGGALRVGDVDGDGPQDIVVATTDALSTSGGAPISSLRLLRGSAGFAYTLEPGLEPSADFDSGQAEDLVLLPSPDVPGAECVLLVGRAAPAVSRGGRITRLLDWNR